MNVILPYCKGALFYYFNVQTLVSYATIETKFQVGKNPTKTPCQKLAKNPSKNLLKIFCAPKSPKMPQKTFNIFFTKNPIKILNNNKKPLILPNKTKNLYYENFKTY